MRRKRIVFCKIRGNRTPADVLTNPTGFGDFKDLLGGRVNIIVRAQRWRRRGGPRRGGYQGYDTLFPMDSKQAHAHEACAPPRHVSFVAHVTYPELLCVGGASFLRVSTGVGHQVSSWSGRAAAKVARMPTGLNLGPRPSSQRAQIKMRRLEKQSRKRLFQRPRRHKSVWVRRRCAEVKSVFGRSAVVRVAYHRCWCARARLRVGARLVAPVGGCVRGAFASTWVLPRGLQRSRW